MLDSWIDLTSDKFEALPPPSDAKERRDFTLLVIGGCLGLAQNLTGGSIEMWKSEKDNTKQSWIKSMTIMNLKILPYPHSLVPICIMKKGEVLIAYSEYVRVFVMVGKPRKYQLYDSDKGTFRRLKVGGKRHRVVTHMESLISPNSDGL
ncbi:Uncharacterized protein TCM_031434 [Theobroma cacao]|uniref:F-box associated beta-propeller type 3 domain-containing protein n=1 Tax=Theobroma cacao TaxID=3641 RepID=A0A061F7S1_THECC|nr:Uncharacterized protein TCM_031434 [Theobroma cacao]